MAESSENKKTIEVQISNSLGLHARPASMFVQLSASFESEITVEKDGETVNGKSLMGLLMLSSTCGTVLKITAEGPDCEKALAALADLVNRKFDEE